MKQIIREYEQQMANGGSRSTFEIDDHIFFENPDRLWEDEKTGELFGAEQDILERYLYDDCEEISSTTAYGVKETIYSDEEREAEQ